MFTIKNQHNDIAFVSRQDFYGLPGLYSDNGDGFTNYKTICIVLHAAANESDAIFPLKDDALGFTKNMDEILGLALDKPIAFFEKKPFALFGLMRKVEVDQDFKGFNGVVVSHRSNKDINDYWTKHSHLNQVILRTYRDNNLFCEGGSRGGCFYLSAPKSNSVALSEMAEFADALELYLTERLPQVCTLLKKLDPKLVYYNHSNYLSDLARRSDSAKEQRMTG